MSGSPRHPVSPAPGAPALETLNAAQLAAVLELLPHREGGYFRETYRSPVVIPTPLGIRSLTTSILYLITLDDPSRFHRLRFDELWFFHAGSPVEMVFLDPLEIHMVGPETPQALAPGGRWMAARVAGPAADGRPDSPDAKAYTAATPGWALVGCVVSPGFEYDDFEAGQGDDLVAAHPQAADYIRELS